MKTRTIILILSVAIALLAACQNVSISINEVITGSGNVISESREVSDFSQVVVNLGADLTLVQGETESLTIEADDNVLPYILTTVTNGKLAIETKPNFSVTTSSTIKATVTFTDLTGLEINGMSNITADDLDLEKLNIMFRGSGSTRLTGTVDTQDITIQGTATLENFDLTTQKTKVDVLGLGTVRVNAADTLDVSIAGNGNIVYRGSPKVTQSILGLGSVVASQ